MPESCRNRGLELHALMRHGMMEAEHIGMQTEPVQRVVAVAVLHVAADRMAHVGRVYANLILPSCLQPVFHETVRHRTVEDMEMGDGIFTAIVHR